MTREEAITRLENIDIREALQEDYDAVEMAIEALSQPEPKMGQWETVPYEETLYCSECNLRLDDEQTYIPLDFCPSCGAKMQGGAAK